MNTQWVHSMNTLHKYTTCTPNIGTHDECTTDVSTKPINGFILDVLLHLIRSNILRDCALDIIYKVGRKACEIHLWSLRKYSKYTSWVHVTSTQDSEQHEYGACMHNMNSQHEGIPWWNNMITPDPITHSFAPWFLSPSDGFVGVLFQKARENRGSWMSLNWRHYRFMLGRWGRCLGREQGSMQSTHTHTTISSPPSNVGACGRASKEMHVSQKLTKVRT